MPTCSFCKKNYENPRGLTVFTFDGKSIYYCSSKCRRNAALKRDPKKTNWVKRTKKDKKVVRKVVEKETKVKKEVKKTVEKEEKPVKKVEKKEEKSVKKETEKKNN